MKNTITVSALHRWRQCSSFRELVHVLLHDVRVEGRMIKAHGRATVEHLPVLPEENEDRNMADVIWLLIDEGLLLIRWSFNLWQGGYQKMTPLALWVPDIGSDGSPLVKSCLKAIAGSNIGRVTERYEEGDLKQEVNMVVDLIVLLQDELSLNAFPLEEIPPEHLLDDHGSQQLCALGMKFIEASFSGYFDLYNCDLFVQGPWWRFSRFPWFRREPMLSTEAYACMVLVAGEDCATLACDGTERRECLFVEMYAGPVVNVIHSLVFRVAETGDWPYDAQFNSRQVREEALKDWEVLLPHDNWEGLFATLCAPDYERHTVDGLWLRFGNEGYRADYGILKDALTYFKEWVETVLETEEGLTVYCIW